MTAKDYLMTSLLSKLTQTWNRFWGDAGGAVLFYVTATLPALVGFSLLAIDASRLMTLHTTLQKSVDALALAAAGELSRAPGSMHRAQVAVDNLVHNKQVFGEGASDIDGTNVTLRFFSALPATDDIPMPTSGGTVLSPSDPDHDALARFVEVTVDSFTMNAIFPASFLGGADRATSRATAVAGMSQVVCRLTPIFICNPWEADGNTQVYENLSIYGGSDTRAERRQQIRVRMGPGGSGWGPGNYGFLDFGNGATALARALAIGSPENCFAQTGVDTEPGQTTGPVENGINTRFGLYPNSMASLGISSPPENQWDVRPAKNVRMGQKQSASKVCEDYTPDEYIAVPEHNPGKPLPRDPIFTDPTARQGTSANPSILAWTDYWDANLNGGTAPSPGNVAPLITSPPHPDYYVKELAATTWLQPTRYEAYQYEINNNMTGVVGAGGEVGDAWDHGGSPPPGGARCYGGPSVATDDIDRRLIGTAILNCKALAAAGNNLNGKQTGIPVAAFAEFFVTEPLEKGGSGTAGDIYTEIVRVIEPGQENSVSRDQVQIYR